MDFMQNHAKHFHETQNIHAESNIPDFPKNGGQLYPKSPQSSDKINETSYAV
jgi:hypothetical protein